MACLAAVQSCMGTAPMACPALKGPGKHPALLKRSTAAAPKPCHVYASDLLPGQRGDRRSSAGTHRSLEVVGTVVQAASAAQGDRGSRAQLPLPPAMVPRDSPPGMVQVPFWDPCT